MIKYIKKYFIFALLASIFTIMEVLADLYQPKLMAEIIDKGVLGINNNGLYDLDIIKNIGICMAIVIIFGGICGILAYTFTNIFGQKYGNAIRKSCLKKIINFSFKQTNQFTTGSLITRMTNDVMQIQYMIILVLISVIRFGLFFIVGSLAILSLNVNFIKIIIPALPVILFEIILILFQASPIFEKIQLMQKKLDDLNSTLKENIAGIRIVKAFVQEKKEINRFFNKNTDFADVQLKVLIITACILPGMNLIVNIAVVAVIYIGGIQVQNSQMAPGAVIAGVTYIMQILSGIMIVAIIFPSITRGFASMKRINEVLEVSSDIENGENIIQNSCIDFYNVCFKYPGQKFNILKNINLHIDKGETVAITGPTGCGKTTLINLLTRFYDATEGEIKLNAKDIQSYNLQDLRKKISVVIQKTELFTTTIKDNILIGNQSSKEEEIKKAVITAQAENFILNQPSGYATMVTEGGMNLSGGQRQRIAIARALINSPQILILDDSTSALDFKTETDFYTDLNKNYPELTKIIVAQRILTVKDADKIIVMDNGEIIASGKHEELLKTCSVYSEMYEFQVQESD